MSTPEKMEVLKAYHGGGYRRVAAETRDTPSLAFRGQPRHH
jgi:hypothetical protein